MWIEGYVSKFDSITKESLNFVEKGLDILALIGFVGSHDGAITSYGNRFPGSRFKSFLY